MRLEINRKEIINQLSVIIKIEVEDEAKLRLEGIIDRIIITDHSAKIISIEAAEVEAIFGLEEVISGIINTDKIMATLTIIITKIIIKIANKITQISKH